MRIRMLLVPAIAIAAVAGLSQVEAAQPAAPNLAGSYRCEPDPSTCMWSGQTFTVTQSGKELDVKNEKGEAGKVEVTSNISLAAGPPWNMLGVIAPDSRVIEWSNGTRWRKM